MSRKKFHVDHVTIYVEKARVLGIEFDDVSRVLSVEILSVVLGSDVIAAKVIYCVIYRKC